MDDLIRRYARLALEVGINLEEGQDLLVLALVENSDLVRPLSEEAYRLGARYVDVQYADNHVRRALIELGPEESLDKTQPWQLERLEYLAANRGAVVQVAGDPEPDLLSDLDPRLVGRARPVELAKTWSRLVNDQSVSWTIVGAPNEGWARTVFGEPEVERLWEAVAAAVRLDEPDPVAAWRSHVERLEARADSLTRRRFDSLRFHGDGTDLTVGLHPGSRWLGGAWKTSWGRVHTPNLPTEEVFTTPDARRTEGVVRSTRPLPFGGTVVHDLELRFDGGVIVGVDASAGAAVVRSEIESNPGAERLGEVALVDGESAVGRTGITFWNVLFDENASCHLAYGAAVVPAVEGAEDLDPQERHERGINHAAAHRDFMIGSPDISVTGVTADGEEVPILVDEEWVLG